MKKVPILLVVILFSVTLGLISCGGGGGNSPSNVVKKGLYTFYDKNYEDVAKLYAKKDGTLLTEEEQAKVIGMLSMAMEKQAKKEGIKNLEILEETISEDGNTATVKYTIFFNNGDEDTSTEKLIRIDNDWYMLITG